MAVADKSAWFRFRYVIPSIGNGQGNNWKEEKLNRSNRRL